MDVMVVVNGSQHTIKGSNSGHKSGPFFNSTRKRDDVVTIPRCFDDNICSHLCLIH